MAYADRKNLTQGIADALWTVMRKMDQAERAWQVEQIKGGGGGG